MKKIVNFIENHSEILLITVALVVFGVIIFASFYDASNKSNVVVLEKENPELIKINTELNDKVTSYESNILVLQEQIKQLQKVNKLQKDKLNQSTGDLEVQIVRVVEQVQDSTLVILLDEVKQDQTNLITTFEEIIELKDSTILQQDNIIQSYVIATDGMSDEIEVLHAKNNELLINQMTSKNKIKKRNRVIFVGGAIVVGGITTAILLNR